MKNYVLIWEECFPHGEGNNTEKEYFETLEKLTTRAIELLTRPTGHCIHSIIYAGRNQQEYTFEPVQYVTKYEIKEVE